MLQPLSRGRLLTLIPFTGTETRRCTERPADGARAELECRQPHPTLLRLRVDSGAETKQGACVSRPKKPDSDSHKVCSKVRIYCSTPSKGVGNKPQAHSNLVFELGFFFLKRERTKRPDQSCDISMTFLN